ncbi:HalOD1 output domain-containing protein [Halopelagius fulvigenes]|uniref:HalOD1 output domain-containing protein n=1 Tax=Halopelagius fulvigenes TaxID=1198324 RepID=A0ABD5TTY7_9EURY
MDEKRVIGERVEPYERNGSEEPVVLRHDWEGATGIAVTVARAVAEAWTGDQTDALSLPPVGSVVDTDALERLFESLNRNPPVRNRDESELAVVQFGYIGYEVSVREDGQVTVEEPPY